MSKQPKTEGIRPTMDDIGGRVTVYPMDSLLVHEIDHCLGAIAADVAAGVEPKNEHIPIYIDGDHAIALGLDPRNVLVTSTAVFAALDRGNGEIDFSKSPLSEDDLIRLQNFIGVNCDGKPPRSVIVSVKKAMVLAQYVYHHRLSERIADGWDDERSYLFPMKEMHAALAQPFRTIMDAAVQLPKDLVQQAIEQTPPPDILPALIASVGLTEGLRSTLGPLPFPVAMPFPSATGGGSDAIN